MKYSILILGTIQDGGFPQLGCKNKCCYKKSKKKHFISCLSILDNNTGQYWLIDITPDFQNQIELLNQTVYSVIPSGIFITHAHVGHYTGLIQLGKEIMNTHQIPVFVMPKMKNILVNNAPWNQLLKENNIHLKDLEHNKVVSINNSISISPFLVPHRNEISECVGYKITSESKSIIYLPDIDNWESWTKSLKILIKDNDLLFIDGTFYSNDEIPNRDLKTIPHPFIKDTLDLLEDLSDLEKKKVYFTHFNHTNKILSSHHEKNILIRSGFNIAQEGMEFDL